MFWANLLHIYQPPTQKARIVCKIAKEAYGPIAEGLKKHPSARLILNINAALTEQLAAYGFEWILNEYRAAAERKQIEFTGSSAYHAILPLLPDREVIRQIELNTVINRRYFKDAFQPKGFFSPEMCYSADVARIAHQLGFRWFIMDEIGGTGEFGKLNFKYLYFLKHIPRLSVFFRNRKVSDKIAIAPIYSPKKFIDILGLGTGSYVITALDGEAFGHHKKNFDALLFQTYDYLTQENTMHPVLISELLTTADGKKPIDPVPSSWASMEGDLKEHLPYGLWQNPKNDIHARQWELTQHAIEAIETSATNTKNHTKNGQWVRARNLLDRALFSDQYWWAGGRKGFGTISIQWLPQMILDGAEMLRDVIAMAPNLNETHANTAKRQYIILEETVRYWNKNRIYNKYKKKNL